MGMWGCGDVGCVTGVLWIWGVIPTFVLVLVLVLVRIGSRHVGLRNNTSHLLPHDSRFSSPLRGRRGESPAEIVAYSNSSRGQTHAQMRC